jgi:hypothetical protein
MEYQLEGLEQHVKSLASIACAPIEVQRADQFLRYSFLPEVGPDGSFPPMKSTYKDDFTKRPTIGKQERYKNGSTLSYPLDSVKRLLVDPIDPSSPEVSRYCSEFVRFDQDDVLKKHYNRRVNPITKFGEAMSVQFPKLLPPDK